MTENDEVSVPTTEDSSGFSRTVDRPCPVCGLAVSPGEIRCPRCHTLLITACTGACSSCGSRSCVRDDDKA